MQNMRKGLQKLHSKETSKRDKYISDRGRVAGGCQCLPQTAVTLAPGRLHHKYLCQKIFSHTTMIARVSTNHAIYWRQREPLPEQDLGQNLLPWSSFTQLYLGGYRGPVLGYPPPLRLPTRGWWEKATKECLHQDILDSLEECFQLKQPSAQPYERHRQMLANIP